MKSVFNMNRFNKRSTFSAVIFLTAFCFLCCFSLMISGCNHGINTPSEEVLLSVSISIDELNGAARSAIPTNPIAFTTGDQHWSLKATNKADGAVVILEWKAEQNVFNGTISTGTWEVSAEGFSDNSKTIKVFAGTTTLTVQEGGKYSAVVPVRYLTAETGNVDLKIKIDTVKTDMLGSTVTVSGGPDSINGDYTLENEVISINKPNVPSGTYNVFIKFFNNDSNLLFIIRQTINVRDNVTTDTWVSSGEPYFQTAAGSSNLEFVIDDDVIEYMTATQFFVKGTGGSLTASAAATNSGSWAAPLPKLQMAVTKAMLLSQITPECEYTIYVDGMIPRDYGILSLAFDNDIKLTVCGLNEDAKKDGFTVTSSGGSPVTSREFDIGGASGKNCVVSLYNLSFTGFNYNGEGGAINAVNMTLNLENCIFKNNSAVNGGGAIYFESGSLNVKNCTFTDNKANNVGGAIYVSGNSTNAVCNLDKCTFEKNTTSANNENSITYTGDDYCRVGCGGAVYGTVSDISITDCTFKENSASHFGGAVSSWGSANLKIQDSTFTKNYISRKRDASHPVQGGAVAVKDASVELHGNIQAKDNTLTVTENGTDVQVKSNFYVLDGQSLDLDSSFSKDSCVGISLQETLSSAADPAVSYKSKQFTCGFSTSDAASKGVDGVFFSDSGYSVGWRDSNHKELSLGLASGAGVNYSVYDSLTFKFNKEKILMTPGADNDDRTVTIVPQLNGKTLTEAQKAKFTKYDIKVYSRGEYTGLGKTGTDASEMSLFFDETEYLWNNSYYWVYVTAVYDDVTYSVQKALSFASDLVAETADDFAEMLSGGEGGDVILGFNTYTGGDAQTTALPSDKFSQGIAGKSLFVVTDGEYNISGGNATITCTSSENRVFAITGSSTNVTISDLTLKSSSYSRSHGNNGKAILVDGGATVTLKNCKVQNFKNSTNGIVEVMNGTLILEDCEITDSSRSSNVCNGGAVTVRQNGICTIKNCKINRNSGQHLGGAILSDGTLEIYDSEIKDNSAQRAAGIYAGGTKLYMKNVTVSGNTTHNNWYASSGGGLWVTAADAKIEDCTFTGNTVLSGKGQSGHEHSGGAAIYVEATTLTVKNCTITGNTSYKNGGAFQLYAPASATKTPTVVLEGTNTISGNTCDSSYHGSTMYVSSEIGGVYNGTTYNKGDYID